MRLPTLAHNRAEVTVVEGYCELESPSPTPTSMTAGQGKRARVEIHEKLWG
jgi:hypothetical protein